MLFSVDKIMKLGGKRLHGQVTSVEVDEEASIDDIKKKNQKTKKISRQVMKGLRSGLRSCLKRRKAQKCQR